MNVRNAIITTIITAGLVSSAAFADDVSSVIEIQSTQNNRANVVSDDARINIQDYVEAEREDNEKSISSNNVSIEYVSNWNLYRVL